MANTKGKPTLDLGIKKKTAAAPIQKKPVKNASKKGTPEKLVPSTNLTKREGGDLANLNFKVQPEFKREFRMDAAEMDITQMELLYRIHKFWKEHR